MMNRQCWGLRSREAFSLLEVLIAIVIIGATAGVIALFQTTSWSSTRSSNNSRVAGQLIEREVERMRMEISLDSTAFPPSDSSVTDPESNISIGWNVGDVPDESGTAIDNLQRVDFQAVWTAAKPETVTVTAYISKDF